MARTYLQARRNRAQDNFRSFGPQLGSIRSAVKNPRLSSIYLSCAYLNLRQLFFSYLKYTVSKMPRTLYMRSHHISIFSYMPACISDYKGLASYHPVSHHPVTTFIPRRADMPLILRMPGSGHHIWPVARLRNPPLTSHQNNPPSPLPSIRTGRLDMPLLY